MRIQRSARLAICATIAGTACAVALPVGVASAAPKPVKESCAHLNGSATSETLTSCKGTSAVGTSGTENPSTSTITWATGLTSVLTVKNKYLTGSKDKCKPPAGDTNDLEDVSTGTVTGGTATTLIGGKVKATVCAFGAPGGAIVTQNFPGKPFQL